MPMLICYSPLWQLDDSERKGRTQQEHIFELKEALTHAQAEVKMKAAQFDGEFIITWLQNLFWQYKHKWIMDY